MKLKIKFIKNFLALVLTGLMIANPVLVPVVTNAQEVTPTPTDTSTPSPTPTVAPVVTSSETPTVTPTETPTPTPAPASSLTTGNADSNSQSSTTANLTTTPDTSQSTTNSADISGSNSASSASGLNSSTNASGDASINTGSSSSTANTNSTINTNVLDASPSADTEATVSATESAQTASSPTPSTVVTLQNSANVQNSTSANSDSGNNQTNNNGGNANITTGSSISTAAVANLINTNLVGSNYRFLIYNIYETQNGTINLNEVWKEISSRLGGNANILPSAANTLAVNITNSANVSSAVTANSQSGQNQANSNAGNSSITTGSSYASANLFNLINTNAVGANFLFVVVNIFGTLKGDIVVPSKEKFDQSIQTYNANGINLAAGSVNIDNYAQVEGDTVIAQANSGNNTSSGSGSQTTITGDAYASATTIDVLNTNMAWENWMSFILNNYGTWTGAVQGWSFPSATDKPAANSQTALTENNLSATPSAAATDSLNANTNNSSNINISNTATSAGNLVSANSDSGNNQSLNNGGDNYIQTGRAVALANLVEFINTNIWGGNFLLAFINLFGQWQGNFVFAYPDLKLSLTPNTPTAQPGQEISLFANYTNVGYEDAKNGQVNINLPADMTYEDNNLGLSPSVSGSLYTFSVGDVATGQSGQIILRAKINDNISNSSQTSSLLEKLANFIVPPALAQGNQKNLLVNAQISTSDPQANQVNHTASTQITVNIPESSNSSNSENVNTGTPQLIVESSTNVGEYVRPGDIVTFTVTIKNMGTGTAHNVVLSQNIHDGSPVSVGDTSFAIGTLETTKTAKITYGVMLPMDLADGLYTSTITAAGNSEGGNNISSSSSVNTFLVKGLASAIIPVAHAQNSSAQNHSGKVLGSQTSVAIKSFEFLPYLLALALGLLWLIERIRRKRLEKKLRAVLKKPARQ